MEKEIYSQAANNFSAMEQEVYSQAVAKSRAGKYQEAIQYFSRVIKINPNFAEAYYGRGLARFDLGNKEEKTILCNSMK